MGAPSEQQGETARCLLVRAGDHLCALPIAAVLRVVRALVVYPLPGGAPALAGLAEFGGEPLPVLDLARLLDSPPGASAADPVTVVVWAGPPEAREVAGLAADEALGIAELATSELVEGGGGLVRGEAIVAGQPVRVLDLEALGTTA